MASDLRVGTYTAIVYRGAPPSPTDVYDAGTGFASNRYEISKTKFDVPASMNIRIVLTWYTPTDNLYNLGAFDIIRPSPGGIRNDHVDLELKAISSGVPNAAVKINILILYVTIAEQRRKKSVRRTSLRGTS
jgi:hypothetical protein